MEKIFDLIADCRFSINDLSRVDLDTGTKLPRFNMPLELGVFLGARRYGQGRQKEKRCLIVDRELYRYRAFISDISGQDISAHQDDPLRVVRIIRNWLRNQAQDSTIPGGRILSERYLAFRTQLPELCEEARLDESDLTWSDFTDLVWTWLELNA
jgi:hypothetical protein